MKTLKRFFATSLFVYSAYFVIDYAAAWTHANPQVCTSWMKAGSDHWVLLLIMPGMGNVCIDRHYWP